MAAQKVLIIDDSKLMRLQVREMLPGNMEILEAVDGADGFEKIQQEAPSLIIMDCFMPKMNGWQVVNKMLSYPELHKVPVVLMSGREEDVQENAGELFDHFEFLAKPFDKAKLIAAIKTSLAKAKQRRVPSHGGSAVNSAETTAMAANVALDATTLLQKLQNEVLELRQHNADLRAEMKQMKQQMVQITQLVKQNLSHV
jgi:CheY-like chemotaxis protein